LIKSVLSKNGASHTE